MAVEILENGAALAPHLADPAGDVLVGVFGGFSAASTRARPEFLACCERHPEQRAFLLDIARASDVPPQLGVDQVPTVLRLRGGKVLQRVVGALSTAFYERALTDCPVVPKPAPGAAPKRAPQVTVYTTTTCPWCTRVKSYLRKADVPFREVNVERDEAAARRMTAKSGQMGVPQVEIDGAMVVGFDQKRIDALLGLSTRPAV